MAYRPPNELWLIDTTVTGVVTAEAHAMRPPWTCRPRFQLTVSGIVLGAAPAGIVQIEHALNSTTDYELLGEIAFAADGTFHAYLEDLATGYPFPLLRAKVSQFTDITSAVMRLAGFFDRGNTL